MSVRVLPTLARRVLLIVGGTMLSSGGYLMTVRAAVGNGPLFAVQDGVHLRTGLSLGGVAVVVGLALVGLGLLLRAPLGPGTVVVPLITGAWITALDPLVPAGTGLAARWAEFVVGTTVMMLGAVLALASATGASAMDGVMLALARRWNRTPARVRVVMELTLAALGAVIGGRIGPGTIVMGACVGPLFGMWSGCLRRLGLMDPTAHVAVGQGLPPRLPEEPVRVPEGAV